MKILKTLLLGLETIKKSILGFISTILQAIQKNIHVHAVERRYLSNTDANMYDF